MNLIDKTFKHGDNFRIGHFCIIEEDVVVGDNVTLGNYVMLKKGTRFGDDVDFADNCVTTGVCWLGNNVAARTGAIISKSNIIEDNCFIGPGVVTNHTKNVTHARKGQLEPEQLLTYISYGSIIGSQVSMLAGIYVAPQTIVGGGAVVVKDLDGYGVYVGSPAQKKFDLPKEYFIEEPEDVGKMYLTEEIFTHFKKYLPDLNLDKYLEE